MNLNEHNKYELLDDYLAGGMSNDDIDKFRAFMQSDADMALDHQIVSEMMQAKAFEPKAADLRNTLASIRRTSAPTMTVETSTEKTSDPLPSNTRKGKMRYLYTALAMAASLLLLFSVYFNNGTDAGSATYELYAMAEPLNLNTKGEVTDLDLVSSLQEAYNNKDFAKALPQIEAYLKVAPRDMDVLLAKGITLTELGRYNEAHQVFGHISSLEPRLKKYQWFDALCYLKEGNKTEARKLLSDLVQSKSYNHDQAQKLLVSGTFE